MISKTDVTRPKGSLLRMVRPVRVVLSRRKGFVMAFAAGNDLPTIKVSRPGIWGNPFMVGPERTQSEAVNCFRSWLTTDGITAGIPERKQAMLNHLHELKGKNLACWCAAGKPCHADVLLELANDSGPNADVEARRP